MTPEHPPPRRGRRGSGAVTLHDMARLAGVAPITVRIDGTAIGRQAAQFIVARAEGQPVERRVVDIGFAIVERDSV